MNLDLFFFNQDLNKIDYYCILINYFEYWIHLNGIHEMKREREPVAFYSYYILIPNIFYIVLLSVFNYLIVKLTYFELKMNFPNINDSYDSNES